MPYTGVHDSQAVRENFTYENTSGQLGTASTTMLAGPTPLNGTRITLSVFLLNTNASQTRWVALRLVPSGGNDDITEDFFYKVLQPKETLVLPLMIVKGGQTLKGYAEASGEVNFYINYKEEL